jgi:1-phosphatidylinositol-3-phosphate 5-kinase
VTRIIFVFYPHVFSLSFIRRNPRILILGFAIEYQRIANKLLSFDALLLQEHGYLYNLVAKIAAFRPDVVVVERAVSRLAQDFLLDSGITLMLNVKPSVIKYLARCTQADLLETSEQLNFDPRLGSCAKFSIRRMDMAEAPKYVASFEGSFPRRGCTVLLRGAGASELAAVKRSLLWAAYIAHSLKLETSFLLNEFVASPKYMEVWPVFSVFAVNYRLTHLNLPLVDIIHGPCLLVVGS